MGEPGGLPSMGSHRVGHDWSDLAAAAAAPYCEEYQKNFFKQNFYNWGVMDILAANFVSDFTSLNGHISGTQAIDMNCPQW